MSEKEVIQSEIRKLGLSEKEAKVYLAALELGNVSVSKLASASKISRPTAYRAVESLERKGLVSLKKGAVLANSPDELLGLLRVEKRRVEEREREFLRIISSLKSNYLSEENSCNVFEGKDGKRLALEEFRLTHRKNIKIIFSGNWEDIIAYSTLEKIYQDIRKRLGKINVQEFSSEELKHDQLEFVKRRKIRSKDEDLVIVLSNKLFLIEKNRVLVVSQKDILRIFSFVFGII